MLKHTTKQIKPDKLQRLKKVKWQLAAVEKRDITDVSLIDEILEEGLSKLERRFGIEVKQEAV